MTLVETITKDLTTAMKEQEKFTLSVLRMLKSALQLEKISKNHDLSDDEALMVIKKQVKMRQDSMEEFSKAGKDEEVENLKKEIEVLEKYLPAQLSDEEIDKALDQIFDELKPASIKDMGGVMKVATERIGAQADMKTVSAKVRERLQ